MSRPAAYTDLSDYERKGHVVATIPATHITRFPSLGQHLLAALAEASRLGLAIEDDDIVIVKTDAELNAALKTAQRGWDAHRDYYEQARAGEPLETWKHYGTKSHARAEGLPVPEFDEDGYATFPAEVAS